MTTETSVKTQNDYTKPLHHNKYDEMHKDHRNDIKIMIKITKKHQKHRDAKQLQRPKYLRGETNRQEELIYHMNRQRQPRRDI